MEQPTKTEFDSIPVIWRRNFMRLAKQYRVLFNKKLSYQQFFGTVASHLGISGCFMEMYRIYVSEKRMPPIEEMEQHSKVELWEEAKLFLGDKATKERCICLVKAFAFWIIFMEEEPYTEEDEKIARELNLS